MLNDCVVKYVVVDITELSYEGVKLTELHCARDLDKLMSNHVSRLEKKQRVLH